LYVRPLLCQAFFLLCAIVTIYYKLLPYYKALILSYYRPRNKKSLCTCLLHTNTLFCCQPINIPTSLFLFLHSSSLRIQRTPPLHHYTTHYATPTGFSFVVHYFSTIITPLTGLLLPLTIPPLVLLRRGARGEVIFRRHCRHRSAIHSHQCHSVYDKSQ